MASSNSPTTNHQAVRQALERARNSEDGQLDPQTTGVLEGAIKELWRNIQAHPDTYVLDADEFALFNYFRDRFRDSPIAQQVVARFWDNYNP